MPEIARRCEWDTHHQGISQNGRKAKQRGPVSHLPDRKKRKTRHCSRETGLHVKLLHEPVRVQPRHTQDLFGELTACPGRDYVALDYGDLWALERCLSHRHRRAARHHGQQPCRQQHGIRTIYAAFSSLRVPGRAAPQHLDPPPDEGNAERLHHTT
jgi:hypothetical protein